MVYKILGLFVIQFYANLLSSPFGHETSEFSLPLYLLRWSGPLHPLLANFELHSSADQSCNTSDPTLYVRSTAATSPALYYSGTQWVQLDFIGCNWTLLHPIDDATVAAYGKCALIRISDQPPLHIYLSHSIFTTHPHPSNLPTKLFSCFLF